MSSKHRPHGRAAGAAQATPSPHAPPALPLEPPAAPAELPAGAAPPDEAPPSQPPPAGLSPRADSAPPPGPPPPAPPLSSLPPLPVLDLHALAETLPVAEHRALLAAKDREIEELRGLLERTQQMGALTRDRLNIIEASARAAIGAAEAQRDEARKERDEARALLAAARPSLSVEVTLGPDVSPRGWLPEARADADGIVRQSFEAPAPPPARAGGRQRWRVVGPGSLLACGRTHAPGEVLQLPATEAEELGALVERVTEG